MNPKKRRKEKRARQRRRRFLQLGPIDVSKGLGHVPGGPEVSFGPFLNVPIELIHPAGFCCPLCREPVKRCGLQTPIVPRIMIHSCKCGPSIVTWEDERSPTIKTWPLNIEFARKADAGVVIFNGGKDTPAGFQGIN